MHVLIGIATINRSERNVSIDIAVNNRFEDHLSIDITPPIDLHGHLSTDIAAIDGCQVEAIANNCSGNSELKGAVGRHYQWQ